ncbi:hypothetical protein ACN47E_001628 [Coniothyrium glycines]
MSRTSTEETRDMLATVNSAAMGTNMPVVTLPDGARVQTGTVGALIIHIKQYDELVKQPTADNVEKSQLEAKMAASLPVLRRAGMFDLFRPEEWTQGSSPGRRLVGQLALRNDHI